MKIELYLSRDLYPNARHLVWPTEPTFFCLSGEYRGDRNFGEASEELLAEFPRLVLPPGYMRKLTITTGRKRKGER